MEDLAFSINVFISLSTISAKIHLEESLWRWDNSRWMSKNPDPVVTDPIKNDGKCILLCFLYYGSTILESQTNKLLFLVRKEWEMPWVHSIIIIGLDSRSYEYYCILFETQSYCGVCQFMFVVMCSVFCSLWLRCCLSFGCVVFLVGSRFVYYVRTDRRTRQVFLFLQYTL